MFSQSGPRERDRSGRSAGTIAAARVGRTPARRGDHSAPRHPPRLAGRDGAAISHRLLEVWHRRFTTGGDPPIPSVGGETWRDRRSATGVGDVQRNFPALKLYKTGRFWALFRCPNHARSERKSLLENDLGSKAFRWVAKRPNRCQWRGAKNRFTATSGYPSKRCEKSPIPVRPCATAPNTKCLSIPIRQNRRFVPDARDPCEQVVELADRPRQYSSSIAIGRVGKTLRPDALPRSFSRAAREKHPHRTRRPAYSHTHRMPEIIGGGKFLAAIVLFRDFQPTFSAAGAPSSVACCCGRNIPPKLRDPFGGVNVAWTRTIVIHKSFQSMILKKWWLSPFPLLISPPRTRDICLALLSNHSRI